ELEDDDEMAGRQVLAQRAAGRQGKDVGNTDALQGVDVGAIVDRGGRVEMAAAVARHEHHREPLEFAEQELVRGLAERRGDAPPLLVLEPSHVIDAAAADDPQNRHSLLLSGVGVSSPSGKRERSWARSTAK